MTGSRVRILLENAPFAEHRRVPGLRPLRPDGIFLFPNELPDVTAVFRPAQSSQRGDVRQMKLVYLLGVARVGPGTAAAGLESCGAVAPDAH